MPVRIYDIAKKLGIESKDVLAKAKELGITGAKVPSSSLDKITAEYLEEKLGGAKPVAVTEPPRPHEPVLIVSAPPEPPPPLPPVDTPQPPSVAPPAEQVVAAPSAADTLEISESPLPPAPVAPPPPPRPAIGEKVGFIQLPQKPVLKVGAKVGSVKLPPKPMPLARPSRPGDRPAMPPTAQRPAGRAPAQPAPPTPPKFVPLATG